MGFRTIEDQPTSINAALAVSNAAFRLKLLLEGRSSATSELHLFPAVIVGGRLGDGKPKQYVSQSGFSFGS